MKTINEYRRDKLAEFLVHENMILLKPSDAEYPQKEADRILDLLRVAEIEYFEKWHEANLETREPE